MSDEKPLIEINDVLGLSKPATDLIEKISNVGVGLFRPTQIKRVAKAEAEARKITALMDMDISDIQQRGMQRLVHEESKKQENMEAITLEAAKQIKDDAKPEDMDNDWIANFSDKCRLVSDKEMQSVWSKLLAGEANKPGTYSKRTVRFVSDFDKKDAQMFTDLMTFTWYLGDTYYPLIYSYGDDIYKNNNLTYSSLLHLDDIGLIAFDNLGNNYLISSDGIIYPYYYGEKFKVVLKGKEKNKMEVGHVYLTAAGRQLAPIADGKPSEEYKKHVLETWHRFGYTVEKITPTQP